MVSINNRQTVQTPHIALHRQVTIPARILSNAPYMQYPPVVVADGEGGIVAAWLDSRNEIFSFDIYTQRIRGQGELLWDSCGVAVVEIPGYRDIPTLVRTSDGNFILAWYDERNSNNPGIYTQKFTRDGLMLWAEDGIRISSYSAAPERDLVADQQGGAIAVWAPFGKSVLYTQRIGSNGELVWVDSGVVVTVGNADWDNIQLTTCSDGQNGIIIVWNYKLRNCYVQRLDSTGSKMFEEKGIIVGTKGKQQLGPVVRLYDVNSFVIVWRQDKSLYCQRSSPMRLLHFLCKHLQFRIKRPVLTDLQNEWPTGR